MRPCPKNAKSNVFVNLILPSQAKFLGLSLLSQGTLKSELPTLEHKSAPFLDSHQEMSPCHLLGHKVQIRRSP